MLSVLEPVADIPMRGANEPDRLMVAEGVLREMALCTPDIGGLAERALRRLRSSAIDEVADAGDPVSPVVLRR